MTRALLTLYLGLSAYLVLLLQALSVFREIAFVPVCLGCLIGLTGSALLLVLHAGARRESISAWSANLSLRAVLGPATLPFVIVLPPLFVLLVVQGWHFPPNDWDSMTYHLARAAYWRQYQSLDHFTTNQVWQVAYPGDAEVLFTVLMVLMHSARAVFLVQLSAYVACGLAIYGVGLQAGARPYYAVFGAGLFATMPEVVLQSNGTYIDITLASYMICAVYFFADFARSGRRISVICLGLALGLAVGAKLTALLALPGLILVAGFFVLDRNSRAGSPIVSSPADDAAPGRGIRLPVAVQSLPGACIVGTLAMVALATPWYIENLANFGSLSGPPQVASLLLVPRRTLLSLGVNLPRHLIAFLDPAGPAMISSSTGSWFYRHVDDARAWLAAITGAATTIPAIEYPNQPYSTSAFAGFDMLRTWYGFSGALTVYLSLIYACRSVRRRWATTATLCAAGATSYLVCTSLLLRWQPWEGHYLTPIVVMACPVAAVAAQRLGACRAGAWALCTIALYAAVGAPTAAVLNEQHPLSSWTESYNDQLGGWYSQITPILDATDRFIPRNAKVGIMFPSTPDLEDWEFPIFGPNLTRTVTPIKLPVSSGDLFTGAPVYSHAGAIDYLITHVSDAIVGGLFAAESTLRCSILGRANFPAGGPFTFFRCTGVTLSDLYTAALGAQNAGDFSGELLQLDEIARTDPTYKSTLFARGWALWNLGQPTAAIAAYRAYLKTQPNDAQAQLDLGYSLIRQGHCAEAEFPLKAVLRLDPKNVSARRELAGCGIQ